MMECVMFFVGLSLGGLFGVVAMCLLQINRINQYKKGDNDYEDGSH